MVFVINSDDFEIDVQYPVNNTCSAIKAQGFPTFYSDGGDYIFLINLWLNHLTNIRKCKNINPNVWVNQFGYGIFSGIDIYEDNDGNMPTRK